jgi:hypothetical protein
MQEHIEELLKLEEERDKSKQTFSEHQKIIKKWFDKHSVNNKNFEVGDLVLKWDKSHEKKENIQNFKNCGLVHFKLLKKIGPSTFILQTLEGEKEILPVNGQILKKYFS